jgi:hypothetical protein
MTLSPSGVFRDIPNTITTYSFLMQFEAVDATERYSSSATTSMWPPVAALPALSTSPGELNIEYTIGNPAPVPVPINIGSTASSLAFSAVATSALGSWLSVSAGSGTTPAPLSTRIAAGQIDSKCRRSMRVLSQPERHEHSHSGRTWWLQHQHDTFVQLVSQYAGFMDNPDFCRKRKRQRDR